MKKPETLNTSLQEFEAAWTALDTVRSTSKTVKIDKRILKALLVDHGVMATQLGWKD